MQWSFVYRARGRSITRLPSFAHSLDVHAWVHFNDNFKGWRQELEGFPFLSSTPYPSLEPTAISHSQLIPTAHRITTVQCNGPRIPVPTYFPRPGWSIRDGADRAQEQCLKLCIHASLVDSPWWDPQPYLDHPRKAKRGQEHSRANAIVGNCVALGWMGDAKAQAFRNKVLDGAVFYFQLRGDAVKAEMVRDFQRGADRAESQPDVS